MGIGRSHHYGHYGRCPYTVQVSKYLPAQNLVRNVKGHGSRGGGKVEATFPTIWKLGGRRLRNFGPSMSFIFIFTCVSPEKLNNGSRHVPSIGLTLGHAGNFVPP